MGGEGVVAGLKYGGEWRGWRRIGGKCQKEWMGWGES